MAAGIELIQVGKTFMRVPRLALGTAPIGDLYRPVPVQQAVETIHWALEHGMNFVDTAPLYGGGKAEQRLGLALQGVPRDRYIIQTKVGQYTRDDGTVFYDYSRDGILRGLEQSLERLGLDQVDSLLIHDPDKQAPERHFRQVLDEGLPTLADLRSQGVIKAIGAGMNQWQMEWEFARNFDVDCFLLAGRYTLLEQSSLDFLEYCRQHHIGIFLGGVYNSGILATGPQENAKYNYQNAPGEVLDRARKIEAVCQRHNVPLRVAAVHFARSHPAVTALIIGSVSKEEAMDNYQSWEMDLPAELWHDLREAGLVAPEAPLPV